MQQGGTKSDATFNSRARSKQEGLVEHLAKEEKSKRGASTRCGYEMKKKGSRKRKGDDDDDDDDDDGDGDSDSDGDDDHEPRRLRAPKTRFTIGVPCQKKARRAPKENYRTNLSIFSTQQRSSAAADRQDIVRPGFCFSVELMRCFEGVSV